MNKMTMPEMSVVRFQESDVIVASSVVRSVTILGVSDGTAHNAQVIRDNTVLGENKDGEDTFTTFFNGISTDTFFWRKGVSEADSLGYVVREDGAGRSISDFDGIYKFVSNDSYGRGLWMQQ